MLNAHAQMLRCLDASVAAVALTDVGVCNGMAWLSQLLLVRASTGPSLLPLTVVACCLERALLPAVRWSEPPHGTPGG